MASPRGASGDEQPGPFLCSLLALLNSQVQIGVVEWKCEAGQNGSDPAQAATFLPPAVWAASALRDAEVMNRQTAQIELDDHARFAH